MAKPSEMTLATRKKLMGQVESQRMMLRTQVRAVAQGYTTALFVYGPGGLGKTHDCTSELDDLLGTSWIHHTAYSTPAALFDSLNNARDNVHLFEDCERLYKQDLAAGILRAACGSPRDKDRIVTYETAREQRRVTFTGGIIIVSNENLAKQKNGILAAVASRFKPVKHDFTFDQKVAAILTMADDGWERKGRKLTPAQCREVARYLVDEAGKDPMHSQLDFRVYHEHALPTYCQWMDNPAGPDWREVLSSKLRGEVTTFEDKDSRDARLADIALAISQREDMASFARKVREWSEQTGLGKSQYYEHLRTAKIRRLNRDRAFGPDDTETPPKG